MWKSLTKSKDPADNPYYINIDVLDITNNMYKLSVTNFVNLWSAVMDSNSIIKIMLDSNKTIGAGAKTRFLKVGLGMLHNPSKLDKIEVKEATNCLDISLTQVQGIVFRMDFTLNLCPAEKFFYDVTRPLLQTIEDQHKSETELRKQIEGMRGYLSKIPKEILMRYEKQDIEDYNDVTHMQAHSVMESVFGKDTEDSVDIKHILNSRPPSLKPTLPIKEEPDSTPSGSSTVTIKKESEQTQSDTHQSQNQRTPPEKSFNVKIEVNDSNVKTEVTDSLLSSQSEPSLSQRDGFLRPKKKRKNLNY